MSEARALTNFAGNSVATVLVGHWTGGLDREQLDRVLAGDDPFDETTMLDDDGSGAEPEPAREPQPVGASRLTSSIDPEARGPMSPRASGVRRADGYRVRMTAEPHETAASARVVDWLRRTWAVIWRLIVTTVGSCLRYRVTGLAAEAAFFAILSVPPLIFALAGAIGYVSDQFCRGPGRATSGRR